MRVDITKDGAGFKASPYLQEHRSLDISRVTVLSGNNGTGKTSLILALAAHFGLSDRYSFIEVGKKKGYSLETRDVPDKAGVVTPDRSFDVVLKYQAPSNKLQVQSLDNMEDICNAFRSRLSQGETAIAKFNDLITQLIEALINGKSILILLDELEVGISAERLVEVLILLGSITKEATQRSYPTTLKPLIADGQLPEKSDIYMLVVTQHPLIRKVLLDNDAQEISFGGWERFKDPFKKLQELSQKSLRVGNLKAGIDF